MAAPVPKTYIGQLANTETDVLAPAAQAAAMIATIVLYNSNTTDETVKLYHKKAGTSYQLYQFVLPTLNTLVLRMPIELNGTDGDSLRGLTTTSAKVNCHVSYALAVVP
jgi:hypothetical protein